jgi:hypothetical protein
MGNRNARTRQINVNNALDGGKFKNRGRAATERLEVTDSAADNIPTDRK